MGKPGPALRALETGRIKCAASRDEGKWLLNTMLVVAHTLGAGGQFKSSGQIRYRRKNHDRNTLVFFF